MANRKNNSPEKGKKQVSALEKARRTNAASKNSKKNEQKNGGKSYWKGVKRELSKVIWPSKKELGTYTLVVVVTCAVFALGFWLIDTGVLALLKQVLGVGLS